MLRFGRWPYGTRSALCITRPHDSRRGRSLPLGLDQLGRVGDRLRQDGRSPGRRRGPHQARSDDRDADRSEARGRLPCPRPRPPSRPDPARSVHHRLGLEQGSRPLPERVAQGRPVQQDHARVPGGSDGQQQQRHEASGRPDVEGDDRGSESTGVRSRAGGRRRRCEGVVEEVEFVALGSRLSALGSQLSALSSQLSRH